MSADELRMKLMQAAIQANLTLSIALANHLELFHAIAAVGSDEKPAHFEKIAHHAKLKPRYTKELLGCLACGDIIQVTEDGEHFYIPKYALEVLATPIKDKAISICSFVPQHAQVFKDIAKVFKKDGPLGMDYSIYGDFYSAMDDLSISLHKKHLISDLIPMTGMKEKLEKGIEFLDVGCGSGFHICELASYFTKSKFIGIDVTPSAIERASERLTKINLKNVTFLQGDARAMNPEWTDKFDMVTIFDACHDQRRPDLAIKEIHRILKPGGIFSMVEIDGTSNIFEDKKIFGSKVCAFYNASVFHCLPVASNEPNALGMGTMMGTKRGSKMLFDAGFSDVKILKIPFFDFNILYLAKK